MTEKIHHPNNIAYPVEHGEVRWWCRLCDQTSKKSWPMDELNTKCYRASMAHVRRGL